MSSLPGIPTEENAALIGKGWADYTKAEGYLSSAVPGITFDAITPCVFMGFGDTSRLIPYVLRSGPDGLGAPTKRKWFRGLYFYAAIVTKAAGLRVRVFVDGRLVQEGVIELDENPSRARRMPLPRGTCGFTVDVEIVGTIPLRAIEADWDPMEGEW